MKEIEERNMNCFMRPYIRAGIALLGAAITLAPAMAGAQAGRISEIVEEPNPLLLHSGAQGYLGVLVGDVDNDSASKLKLKEVRGAVITLIDHDAPAAQVGLRVNDVVLEINGQTVESAEAFGRMMREIPPGRKITLTVSRDGATQTLPVQLVDRKKLDTDVWNKLNSDTDSGSSVEGLGILGNGAGGDVPLPGGFHMPFVGSSTLKVGALVEPLTSQMAEYLGVQNGLMVKQVVRKSEASAAGMKAFDVILKVGSENISTVSDWERSMRANQGKAVQITILRGQKQLTITLQVDSKRRGEVEFEQLLPDGPGPLMAYVDPDDAPDLAEVFGMDQMDQSAAEALREQAEKLKDQLGVEYFAITPEQAEALRKQAEQQIADALKDKNFGIDQKQLDQMKQQMQEWQKCFDSKSFQFDQQQMDELKKQMQQFGEAFKPESFKFDQKQMDEFKRQMEQFRQPHPLDEKMREQMKQQMDQLKRQLQEMQAQSFGHWV